MNIQIFGTKKCNDTKKAQRYFKERGIKFQFIDMREKEISEGEFCSVCQVVGGIDNEKSLKYLVYGENETFTIKEINELLKGKN